MDQDRPIPRTVELDRPPGAPIPVAAHVPPQKTGGSGGLIALFIGLGCFGLLLVVGVAVGVALLARGTTDEVAVRGVGPDPLAVEPVAPIVPPVPPVAPIGAADPTAPERYRVPVTATMPSRGPADAPVTIVEFTDFQCPFCSRVQSTLSQVLVAYPNQVRIVFRNNPLAFHREARPAAVLALEAHAQGGNDRFWHMHDKLFQNQRALSEADLDRYAIEVGLDLNRYRGARLANVHDAAIQADQDLANQLGARGTPAFFINGRLLSGAQPVTRFREIIDDELRRVAALQARGVPAAQVYDTLIRDGRTTAAPRAGTTPTPSREEEDPNRVYRVPVGSSPQQGPRDALVTIVVFSEFQCPFCSRLTPTLDRLHREYRRDLRIVFKHNPLPFHQRAMPAAQFAVEAQQQNGDDGFWRAHDMLFENQRDLEDADLMRYAGRLGLSRTGVRRALAGTHDATIRADMDLARTLDARGTPTAFVNGKKLRGAQPYERFRSLIEQELAAARIMERTGTARSQIYDRIMARATP